MAEEAAAAMGWAVEGEGRTAAVETVAASSGATMAVVGWAVVGWAVEAMRVVEALEVGTAVVGPDWVAVAAVQKVGAAPKEEVAEPAAGAMAVPEAKVDSGPVVAAEGSVVEVAALAPWWPTPRSPMPSLIRQPRQA